MAIDIVVQIVIFDEFIAYDMAIVNFVVDDFRLVDLIININMVIRFMNFNQIVMVNAIIFKYFLNFVESIIVKFTILFVIVVE